jgi:hypothetical protein
MRTPSIIDVLRAVKDVADAHPDVAGWWYAPARRLRLRGELPGTAREAPLLEVVVEVAGAAEVDCAGIAAELSSRFAGQAVSVRPHRGAAEERQLFRLLSGRSRERGAPESAERTA